MKKVIVYNNFGDNLENWIKRLSKQSPQKHVWGDIELVSNLRESDFVVILDGVSQLREDEFDIFLQKDKIFIQREPEQVQGKLSIDRSKFVKVVTYDEYCPYVDWWLDMDYDQLSNLQYKDVVKSKKNPICIVSDKSFTDGQRKRLLFLKELQSFLEIDFYGKRNLSNIFNNYCGTPEYDHTSSRDKSRILEYNISISLENGKRNNFFTRLWEDLLCWTLPVYWGCPNLNNFLPDNSYRYVDIEQEISTEYIKHLFRPVSKEEVNAIEESRNLLLNKYNFFPYISNILKEL